MPPIKTTILLARWIAPMTGGPIIEDGAIAMRGGVITMAGTRGDVLRASPANAQRIDVGDAVILPGLINAHVHLELSNLRAGKPPGSFDQWLGRVMGAGAALADPSTGAAAVRSAVEEGVRQCLRFGVTSVGDITRYPAASRKALVASPLRGVSYGEVSAMAKRRDMLEPRLAAAGAAPAGSGDRVRIGISPHAPYSIESAGYQRCLDVARGRNLPLTTHLAEMLGEREFLAGHSGPFRALWDRLGDWDDRVPRFAGGPIRFAASLGLLDYPALLAHVNYCDDDELALLSHGEASVAYCPRTHAYFSHPPHRWRDMLARGVNVAVGTDSCASSPDLNLVDDLRLVRQFDEEIDAQTIWSMGTLRAARALQMESQVGSIEPGKFGDFVTFRLPSGSASDPLNAILQDAVTKPAEIWIGGKREREAENRTSPLA